MSHTSLPRAGRVPDRLLAFVPRFDEQLPGFLPASTGASGLEDALHYAVLAPGKRIRPYLVVRCCELVGAATEPAWPVAAAVECIHAFSLVHDDLPAMDDDDLRRGRPTTHKKFGEGLAILAGDALVVLAFEILARHVADRGLCADMILELAQRTGWAGMIGGQAADISDETQPPSLPRTEYIHQRKTASLFEAACRLGAMVAGAGPETVAGLGRFGGHLGRAFQIADDLLDVSTGNDARRHEGMQSGRQSKEAGKQTYPRCVGVEQSRMAAQRAAEAAIAQLEGFGPVAEDLRQLAVYAAERSF
jgi:geranylgeranyl diphosphate synthase type II